MSKHEYSRLVESQTKKVFEKVESFSFNETLQRLTDILNHCHINPTKRKRHERFAIKHRSPAPFDILLKIHEKIIQS